MAIGACERDRDGSAALIDAMRFIFAPSFPLSVGFLPVFSPPKGAAQLFLESIALLPPPTDPIALLCVVVLGHPFDQLLEDTHPRLQLSLWKRSWMTLFGHPKPIPMNRLPLAQPLEKHVVPDSVVMRARGRMPWVSATTSSSRLLFLFLGKSTSS